MKKRILFVLCLLAYISLYFFVNTKLTGAIFVNFLAPLMFLLLPIAGSFLGFIVVYKYGLKTKHGKSFLFLALGNTFFLIGELLWYHYSLILNISPYPSLADLFYLLAYPLFFIGFVLEVKMGEAKINFKTFLITISSLLLLGLLFFYNLWLSVLSSGKMGADSLIATLYNVGDIVLILICGFLFLMLLEYRKGRIFICWLWILVSFIFTLAADILFSNFLENFENNLLISAISDSLWMLGYGLFAIGMMCFSSMLSEKKIEILKKIKM